MQQAHRAVAIWKEDEDFRTIPLHPTPEPPRAPPVPARGASARIKDALRRWLDQEM
jgi:hypothetical protein